VFYEDYLQLSDQEAEHGADGDHEHLVILEHGSKDGFVLVRGQSVHLLDDEVLDVEGLCGVVLGFLQRFR
jgi:hypothetical protein